MFLGCWNKYFKRIYWNTYVSTEYCFVSEILFRFANLRVLLLVRLQSLLLWPAVLFVSGHIKSNNSQKVLEGKLEGRYARSR